MNFSLILILISPHLLAFSLSLSVLPCTPNFSPILSQEQIFFLLSSKAKSLQVFLFCCFGFSSDWAFRDHTFFEDQFVQKNSGASFSENNFLYFYVNTYIFQRMFMKPHSLCGFPSLEAKAWPKKGYVSWVPHTIKYIVAWKSAGFVLTYVNS